MTAQASLLLILKIFFALAAVVAMGVFALRPLWGMLTRREEMEQILHPSEASLPEDQEELQIPTALSQQKPDREQMLHTLKTDPVRTAMLMREFIKDKGRKKP
jgi:hypothetical protein